MPEIAPFRSVTYDRAKVGDLSAVITQPYDKIDPDLQKRYLARSPHSAVRLVLDPVRPADGVRDNRYTRSAAAFQEWLRAGVVRRDETPALYLWTQTYRYAGGEEKTRRGITALVKIEEFGKGSIHPHEHTHSGPKEDRLKLLRATKAHFEHIFLMYSDPRRQAVDAAAKAAEGREPDLEAVDDFDVRHRVWRVADPKTIAAIRKDLKRRDAFIADGHHRYETALNYRNEQRQQGGATGAPGGADWVMATLVNFDDEGVTILATHRALRGKPGLTWARFREQVAPWFEVREYPGGDDAANERAMTELLEDLRFESLERPCLGTAFGGGAPLGLLLARDLARIERDATGPESKEWKRVDVCFLHRLVLDRVLGVTAEDVTREKFVTFHRDPREAAELVRSGHADAAFFLNPIRMETILERTKRGERFPQKTTDFYPKMITGLIFNQVE